MNRARRLFCDLVRSEDGGEVIEYVLVAGLIIAAVVAIVGAVGVRVVARWNTVVNSSL